MGYEDGIMQVHCLPDWLTTSSRPSAVRKIESLMMAMALAVVSNAATATMSLVSVICSKIRRHACGIKAWCMRPCQKG